MICLTPVRNESWIIEPFVAASKMWADHVIVADQGSTDGTLELVQSTRDVETIINAAKTLTNAAVIRATSKIGTFF